MKSFKTAIIAGAIALVAVIITVIVLAAGNDSYGLYISSVSGDVVISSSEGTQNAAAETYLSSGDALTVNAGGSCTLIYRSKDNTDENYIVLEPSTQVLATGKYTGKSDDVLYLNRGAVIVSAMNKSKRNITIRTADASVTTKGAAIRVAYELGDEASCTLAASFGGSSEIQLYSSLGIAIDRDGAENETPEVLGEGLSAKIVSGTTPYFEYLNIKTDLSALSAYTLKELLTISAFHDEELSFTAAEIKAAYDAAPAEEASEDDESSTDEEDTEETTTAAAVTEATTVETAVTSEETTVTTTTAAQTTTAYTTTTYATTTQPPQTTTTAAQTTTTAAQTTTASASGELITVYIIVDDEITTQEVAYGEDAVQPADPVVEGRTFVGWDGSFTSITKETTISAIFEDDDTDASVTTANTFITFETTAATTTATTASSQSFTVTVVVNSETTTQTVAYGGSAVLPAVNVSGYTFAGWSRSPDNITEDCTITAILIPDSSVTASSSGTYTVTFVVDGVSYPVTVSAGSSAVAPVSPTINSSGQTFIGWDTDFSSVTSDLTVNAIFM